jgi:hypothetical protein
VLRSDHRVFAHLHPAGNFSMAAQVYFDTKMDRETGGGNPDGTDRSKMRDIMRHDTNASPLITIPYQFPSAGDYLIWVQIKSDDRILTGVFETTVE